MEKLELVKEYVIKDGTASLMVQDNIFNRKRYMVFVTRRGVRQTNKDKVFTDRNKAKDYIFKLKR